MKGSRGGISSGVGALCRCCTPAAVIPLVAGSRPHSLLGQNYSRLGWQQHKQQYKWWWWSLHIMVGVSRVGCCRPEVDWGGGWREGVEL